MKYSEVQDKLLVCYEVLICDVDKNDSDLAAIIYTIGMYDIDLAMSLWQGCFEACPSYVQKSYQGDLNRLTIGLLEDLSQYHCDGWHFEKTNQYVDIEQKLLENKIVAEYIFLYSNHVYANYSLTRTIDRFMERQNYPAIRFILNLLSQNPHCNTDEDMIAFIRKIRFEIPSA